MSFINLDFFLTPPRFNQFMADKELRKTMSGVEYRNITPPVEGDNRTS